MNLTSGEQRILTRATDKIWNARIRLAGAPQLGEFQAAGKLLAEAKATLDYIVNAHCHESDDQ